MQQTPDSATSQSGVCVYPDSADLLALTAERVSAALSPPDFSTQTIICENPGAARDFARHLALRHNLPAILAPNVCSLRQWAATFSPLAEPSPNSTLDLVELLRGRKKLLGDADPWRVSEELLGLFSELTLAGQTPAEEQEQFTASLAAAYQSEAIPVPLSREAHWLYEFWKAWHLQGDADQAYLHALKLAADAVTAGRAAAPLLVGLTQLANAELNLLKPLLASGKVSLLIHSGSPLLNRLTAENCTVTDPTETILAAVHDRRDRSLRDRAKTIAEQLPVSPLQNRLKISRASDPEQEAKMLALQVRYWLKTTTENILIIAESRETGRRLRALLDRVNIPLNDRGGWALSTTSAATALERWLQSIEEDYAAAPLLDLLKSPFIDAAIFADDVTGEQLNTQGEIDLPRAAWRFEQDIVRHEQVARGLPAYQQALARRRERLDWPEHSFALVKRLLLGVKAAGQILAEHRQARLAPRQWLSALTLSLETLGLQQGLESDAAGQQIIEMLELLKLQIAGNQSKLDWAEFRTWLGLQLEQHEFRAEGVKSRVMLGNTAQAYLEPAPYIIVADATEATFNAAKHHSFFNDGVRANFNLSTRREQRQLQQHRLRRLICASQHCLFVWPEQIDGRPQTLLNDLQLLEQFNRIGWQQSLSSQTLAHWAESEPEQAISQLPQRTTQPRPEVKSVALPSPLSASAHQNLINCPYQFLYANMLGLQAPEELREMLEKSDFGELVHECLHRYMQAARPPESRAAATQRLADIGREVFAKAVAQNAWHSGWLQRFETLIEGFLDWQAEHANEWKFKAGEFSAEQSTAAGFRLRGRLDRVDHSKTQTDAIGIVDYKTGAIPNIEDVLSGEAVQLPSYAAMAPSAVAVEYCQINSNAKAKSLEVRDEALVDLRDAVIKRLDQTLESIEQGAQLPAHGDANTCSYCDYSGICRREIWSQT